ncbi:hypothetical protein GYMLUDRAFT_438248 [Collybiopsis luxurians FD-317 M1]|uniref:Unplaced genomic scaffold GYMLUscaffold_144, whole genome shotgun sequence n=1 Tax=Collybiopsis luxurians FD-317 M1 TaxID=944289 RepID=A0A0D0BME7_9AGAR|nr:hypothetical protein GYMLUDRAFT_438248 [Collybiopsis luxurians FD-317 M1]
MDSFLRARNSSTESTRIPAQIPRKSKEKAKRSHVIRQPEVLLNLCPATYFVTSFSSLYI